MKEPFHPRSHILIGITNIVFVTGADNAKELFAKPAPDKTPLKLVEFIRRTPGFAADLAAQITYKLQLAENKLSKYDLDLAWGKFIRDLI